jgi:NAD(P)-dependent dehydrogenase (short-subunit alcohol dehydrogenase family)
LNTIRGLSSLQSRKALITGGAGNLGRVFAETLAELGADLLLVDLPGTNLEALSESLEDRWQVKVEIKYCDLENFIERARLISSLNEEGKPLHIIVNNAAFVGTSSLKGWNVSFANQSVDTWRRAMEVNLTAVFDLCQGLAPLLTSSKGASIINIGSIYGLYAPDWSLYEGTDMSNPAAYAASKGGLIQLSRWLATTLAPEVRVNVISPGGIRRNQDQKFIDRYELKTPLKRMATEVDFKGALAYLASDLSNYVTGQIVEVDGGWGIS